MCCAGDPIPEFGMRNEQALLTELVVGGGSGDPRSSTVKKLKPDKLGFSGTVSLPSEDSDLRLFNASALDGRFDGDVVCDDGMLPPGDGRSHRDYRFDCSSEENMEELAYCVFAESMSNFELTDNEGKAI